LVFSEIRVDFIGRDWNVYVSAELEEQLGGLVPGDTLTLSYGNYSVAGIGPVVTGRMPAEEENSTLVLPMRTRDLFTVTARFVSAELTIDTTMNRELGEFREIAGRILARNTPELFSLMMLVNMPFEIEIHDEDFFLVLSATEDVLALLAVLYPVFVFLSVLTASGLAVLLTLQGMKVTSLLRVLGTNKKRVFSVMCGEQLLVCSAGVLIGTAALATLFGISAVSPVNIGLYLGGTLIGVVAATVTLVARSPLALLQVRE